MALNKKHTPYLDALIAQAASEVRSLNPHLVDPQQDTLPEVQAEIERERADLEHIWDELARQRGKASGDEPVASAVNEDRGE